LSAVPALEIGGTHVASAMVDVARPVVVTGSWTRMPLDADDSADSILATIVACAGALAAARGSAWGIAIPGPFDYSAGIGRFEGVAKFGALEGVNVGRRLMAGLPTPTRVAFLNDAAAFLIGEWAAGAAIGHDRVAGITLGTGIGSAFLAGGRIVNTGPDVPPNGEVHHLSVDGRPLEETVSRRAIVAAYLRLAVRGSADRVPDVAEIASLARQGESPALAAMAGPLRALGRTLAPWLERFGATVLVVGGSIAGSWDLVEPPLRDGLGAKIELRRARLPDDAALIGAALFVVDSMQQFVARRATTRHG